VDRARFVALADECISREEEAKAIKDEIKESLSNFAEQEGLQPKSIKKLYKEYKSFLKDQTEYTVVDREVSQALNDVIYTEQGE
jgi:hypothetical protein